MITQEDINAMNYTNNRDVEVALECVEGAIHRLDETGDIESQALDTAYGHLTSARHLLQQFLNKR